MLRGIKSQHQPARHPLTTLLSSHLASIAMKLLFALLACAVSTLAVFTASETPFSANGTFNYTNCGSSTDLMKIKSIRISPTALEAGKDVTITVQVQVQQDIVDGAYADVQLSIGGYAIPKQTIDLCKEGKSKDATVSCPIPQGDRSLIQTITLPKSIPPTSYNALVKGYSSDHSLLFCINATASFQSNPSAV
ncbi:ML domain-containing protein [Irpex rosettiformis]|uniref:ML domain-containing protein n=1 Tax=Irpex rosettiformis TaxID=378272 RepID=A0ACB8TYT5_9APHY|nr:ML domain-containing protein [Irpex rosettiformis]